MPAVWRLFVDVETARPPFDAMAKHFYEELACLNVVCSATGGALRLNILHGPLLRLRGGVAVFDPGGLTSTCPVAGYVSLCSVAVTSAWRHQKWAPCALPQSGTSPPPRADAGYGRLRPSTTSSEIRCALPCLMLAVHASAVTHAQVMTRVPLLN